MIISEMWKEYLSLIDTMTKYPATYGLDQRRTELHEMLFKKYAESGLFKNIIKERFNNVCHNLDKVIDFHPPIQRNDSINVYAHDIEHYMMFAGRLYMIGHTNRIK